MTKVRQVTVYLLKPAVKSPKEALKYERGLTEYRLDSRLTFTGSFYVQTPSPCVPAWVDFVQEGLVGQLKSPTSATVSAVLLIRRE
ncbi:MAG: DUF6119 family protein [Bacillota bacterium]